MGRCKPVLTWRCFSAETQPSPLEAVEVESEELCREAPVQVKEPEAGKGSCRHSCLLVLGSAGLCQRCPWVAGTWASAVWILTISSLFAFLPCFITPVPFGWALRAAASGAFQSHSWRVVINSSLFFHIPGTLRCWQRGRQRCHLPVLMGVVL